MNKRNNSPAAVLIEKLIKLFYTSNKSGNNKSVKKVDQELI